MFEKLQRSEPVPKNQAEGNSSPAGLIKERCTKHGKGILEAEQEKGSSFLIRHKIRTLVIQKIE